jgi:hypothetical protein
MVWTHNFVSSGAYTLRTATGKKMATIKEIVVVPVISHTSLASCLINRSAR